MKNTTSKPPPVGGSLQVDLGINNFTDKLESMTLELKSAFPGFQEEITEAHEVLLEAANCASFHQESRDHDLKHMSDFLLMAFKQESRLARQYIYGRLISLLIFLPDSGQTYRATLSALNADGQTIVKVPLASSGEFNALVNKEAEVTVARLRDLIAKFSASNDQPNLGVSIEKERAKAAEAYVDLVALSKLYRTLPDDLLDEMTSLHELLLQYKLQKELGLKVQFN